MSPTPLTRAEFLKILAAGSAGVLFLGGAEEALAGITGTNDALDQAALDGDARAARAAGTVLAVAKGTSADSNVQRVIAATCRPSGGSASPWPRARTPRATSSAPSPPSAA